MLKMYASNESSEEACIDRQSRVHINCVEKGWNLLNKYWLLKAWVNELGKINYN